jgi:hypothetical protein
VSVIDDLLELRRALLPDAFRHISRALAMVHKNDVAYSYTIVGFDRSSYITRTLLPRHCGWRPLIHEIHREDLDDHPHNHPWTEAHFTPLCGSYVEERVVDGRLVRRCVRPGDVNRIQAIDFHRVIAVDRDTWTVGLVGERVQDWGFLVDGTVVPHADYFRQRGDVILRSEGRS